MSYKQLDARWLRLIVIGVAPSLVAAACTATTQSVGERVESSPAGAALTSVTPPSATVEAMAPSRPSTTNPTTTVPATTTSTTTSTTTTTTTEPPLDVFAPDCVVRAAADTSLEDVAIANDVADVVSLWFENDRPDTIAAGSLIDLCAGNEVNDIDGQPRPPIEAKTLESAVVANVERQQSKLNELFAVYGTAGLDVDGISGPRTGQQLCAARLALGLVPTTARQSPVHRRRAVSRATCSRKAIRARFERACPQHPLR